MDFKIHDLQIRNESNNAFMAYFWPGEVALYSAGNKKFSTVGSGIKVHTVGDGHGIILDNTTYRNNITAESNLSGANSPILQVDGKWNNTQVAYVDLSTGDDTTDKDDGIIRFFTKPSGGTIAERLRIDSSGRLLLGGQSARTFGGGTYPHLQIEGLSEQAAHLTITRVTNDTYGSVLGLAKSRGTSLGSNTIVQDNDTLGVIQFRGTDGSDIYSVAASIHAEVDGSPSNGTDMPGALVLGTTIDGASSPTERLRINSSGNITIGTAAAAGGKLYFQSTSWCATGCCPFTNFSPRGSTGYSSVGCRSIPRVPRWFKGE